MNSILEFQKAARECQQVWCVYITCDGEVDLVGVYQTKEGAEHHKAWQNSRSAYYGRASIGRMPLMTDEIAKKQFTAQPEQEKQ